MNNSDIRTKKRSNQGVNKDKTLINFHMFKTAGTTMDRTIERQFPKEVSLYVKGGSPQNKEKSVNLLRSLSEKDKERIRYVWGGTFFGVHEYLPGPYTYVTLIRDPVERVVSEYYHVLRTQDHPAHSEVVSRNMSLEDYVSSGMWLSWNGQIRHLRGAPEGLASFGQTGPLQLSEDDLETAKANIRGHFLVGITERFDESLIALKRSFGWKTGNILYVKQKVAENRPSREAINPETIKLIEAHNELDIQLYEFAKQMFEERISQQDSSFRRELQIFKFCNKIYAFFMNKSLVVIVLALFRGDIPIANIFNFVRNRVKAITGKSRP